MSHSRIRSRRDTRAVRTAVRRAVGILALAVLAATPAVAGPQASARDLFLEARARDDRIRAALDASPPEPPPTRDAMRQVVAAYRQVVVRYPSSGYCDNALWLAAQLSVDTFVRHGDQRDRKVAVDLLNALVREYPSSRLVERARADAARVAALVPQGAPAAAGPPPPPPASSTPLSARPVRPDLAPAASTGTVLMRDISRRTTADGAVVEIEFDGPAEYKEERLDNPSRIFFDLVNTRTTDALRDAVLSFESGPVRQIRLGRHPINTTRIVVETVAAARCVSHLAAGSSRLVVTCSDGGTGTPSPPPAQDAVGGGDTPRPQIAAPATLPPATAGLEAGRAPALPSLPPLSVNPPSSPAPAAPLLASPPAPAAPSANGRGGFSMARQLGLRVGRIVIDAGHGGKDPGAAGPGYSEAGLTLDIALRLEKLLAREPGVEVVLTRRADEYVPLQERTAIANREEADLFVSIHANASRNRSARGVESYLLNFASTPDAAAVAARENASSTLTMSHLNDLVKQIALNSKRDESRDLAGLVQNAMVRKLRPANQQLKDLGVKQAPFVVLVGASMPSVLVEVAFVTNKQEGRLLGTGTYRQRIAEALFDGVRRYLRTLKRAQTDTEDVP